MRVTQVTDQSSSTVIRHRLIASFGVAYLTLTGVTQSVVTAVLATRVEANFEDFGIQNWLMTVSTFLLIVLVWNEYLIASIAYFWTPTVADALIPFTLLAVELFVVHTIYPGVRAWLGSVSVMLGVGCTAFAYGFWQAGRHRLHNAEVIKALKFHRAITMISTGAGCLVFGAAALLYDVTWIHAQPTLVVVIALLLILATVLRGVPYWQRVTRFAESHRVD
jgi:hypothetical protein